MVNDRLLKFTYEKNNIKTKFTTNNVIHVLFYSENNLLLSKVLEKDKDLLNFFNKTIINKSASTFLVRAEKGNFLLIRRKTKIDDLKQKYLQDLGGAIFNKIKSIGCSEVKFYEDNSKILEQLCLGVLLSSYKFDNYKMVKSKEINDLKKITVVTEQNENFSKMFEEIKNLAQGVFRARDLVWQPPNILYPSTFADECKKLKKIGLKVNVYNEQQLDKMGMSALLAVGRGSRKDSKVVVMEWLGGKKNTPPMAFIGKGVCFDSGGLSLKPPKSMEDMK